jgi:hypothetical protein
MGRYGYPVTGQRVIPDFPGLASGGKPAVVNQRFGSSFRSSGVIEIDQLSAVREAGAGDATHESIIPQVTKSA